MGLYRPVSELINMTQPNLLPGLIDTLKKTDQFTAALMSRAKATTRPSIQFNRRVSVPAPQLTDCSTTFTSVATSSVTMNVALLPYTVPFTVCKIGEDLYSDPTDVIQSEIDGAMEGISHDILAQAVGNGNGTTALFGLDSVATNTFPVAVSGAFSLADLDSLITAVKVGSTVDNVFVASPATVNIIARELREASGGMVYQVLAGTDMNVLQYRGYSILAAEGAAAGKVWLVNLDQGYSLFYAEQPNEDGVDGSTIFKVEEIGKRYNAALWDWHITYYLAAVSLNPIAIAELSGVS